MHYLLFLLSLLLPWKFIASFIYLITHIPVPYILRTPLYQYFATLYGINLSEIPESLNSYKRFSDFFIRKLKSDSRQIEPGILTSPVDAQIRTGGLIDNGNLLQIKGQQYLLKNLLQDEATALYLEGGHYLNFYLSPKDYHRVHVPCDCKLLSMRFISGTQYPVNNFFNKMLKELFCKNLRMVFTLEHTTYGKFYLVMVGAANVGRIVCSFLAQKAFSGFSDNYAESFDHVTFKKGEELAYFDLGSSVVLLFPKTFVFDFITESRSIFMGQSLERS